jgi:hypothetical protein
MSKKLFTNIASSLIIQMFLIVICMAISYFSKDMSVNFLIGGTISNVISFVFFAVSERKK